MNLQDILKAQSLKFMDQVQKFSEKYGLSSNTKEKRLENARLNLKKVAAEMDVVEKGKNSKENVNRKKQVGYIFFHILHHYHHHHNHPKSL